MNLDQLQAMSDAELNELSAVKVMGWERRGGLWMNTGYLPRSADEDTSFGKMWNPTTDMNDAMELQNALNEEELQSYTLRLMKMVSAFGHITYRDVTNILKSTARERTIASILAKEE